MGKVPRAVWTEPVVLSEDLSRQLQLRSHELVPLKLGEDINPEWSRTGSSDRMAEFVRWQRRRLVPKHHLSRKVRVIGSFHSIWPLAYWDTVDSAIRSGGLSEQVGLRIEDGQLNWNQIQLVVDVQEPGVYTLPIFADRWWEVVDLSAIDGQPQRLDYRVGESDLVELALSAGNHQLQFRYRPWHIWLAGCVSGLGWFLLIGWSGALGIARWRAGFNRGPGSDKT